MTRASIWIGALALATMVGTATAAGEKERQAGHEKMEKQAGRKMGGKLQARGVIGDWPSTAKSAAEAMLTKYGEPDGVMESMLVWHDTGPFKRTIVYKEEVEHDFPIPHKDVLEQFIDMDVPAEKFDELARYDGSVIVERTKAEISARCDKELANILAINLAKKIIDEEMSVEEARQSYADAIRSVLSGERPALTQSFQFQVAKRDITNKDEAVLEMQPVRGEEPGEMEPQKGTEQEKEKEKEKEKSY